MRGGSKVYTPAAADEMQQQQQQITIGFLSPLHSNLCIDWWLDQSVPLLASLHGNYIFQALRRRKARAYFSSTFHKETQNFMKRKPTGGEDRLHRKSQLLPSYVWPLRVVVQSKPLCGRQGYYHNNHHRHHRFSSSVPRSSMVFWNGYSLFASIKAQANRTQRLLRCPQH